MTEIDREARPYVLHDGRDGRRCDMTLKFERDLPEGGGSVWACPDCGARFEYLGPEVPGHLAAWDPIGRDGPGPSP